MLLSNDHVSITHLSSVTWPLHIPKDYLPLLLFYIPENTYCFQLPLIGQTDDLPPPHTNFTPEYRSQVRFASAFSRPHPPNWTHFAPASVLNVPEDRCLVAR